MTYLQFMKVFLMAKLHFSSCQKKDFLVSSLTSRMCIQLQKKGDFSNFLSLKFVGGRFYEKTFVRIDLNVANLNV